MKPEFNWANALDLVHRAYHVAEVDRPLPAMKTAWKQYQELITFAVEQLQQATDKLVRDDSWKMMGTNSDVRGY